MRLGQVTSLRPSPVHAPIVINGLDKAVLCKRPLDDVLQMLERQIHWIAVSNEVVRKLFLKKAHATYRH
jgi:hypothetical protein